MKNKHIKDGRYLDHSYLPPELPGREKQIEELTEHLCDCDVKSRNAIIIGDRGTGKTAVSRKVCINTIPSILQSKGLKAMGVLINCKQSNTRFQVYQNILFHLTEEHYTNKTEHGARMYLLSLLKNLDCIIIVLDEADMLKSDHQNDLLYDLSRFQEQGLTDCRISVVAISNNAYFINSLDSKTRSSLCQAEFVFEPYNAHELESILQQRALLSLYETSYKPFILKRIAAIAAQEEGDARYAIWLLSQAAEIAGRRDQDVITIDCVDNARSAVEEERIRRVVESLVFQKKLVLMGCITAVEKNNGRGLPTTGDVYTYYQHICRGYGKEPVTDRRIIDFISDLDMMGIIKKNLVSRGRYGRTHEISIQVPLSVLKEVLSGEQTSHTKNIQQATLFKED